MSRVLGDVGFVHLKVHSSFSLLEGSLRIDELEKLAIKDRHPGAGPDRHQQPVRRAGVLREAVGRRRAADHRRRALRRDRRRASRATAGSTVPTSRPHAGAARRRRGRLRQPDEAGIPRLSWAPRRGEPPHVQIARPAGLLREGLIALTGGPDGPIDSALRRGPAGPRRRAARPAREGLRRPALCRDPAPRPQARARHRAGADRSRLRARAAARRHQRGLFRRAATTTRPTTRCCASPRARYVAEDKRRRLTPRALLQDAAPRWRSCSPTCRRRSTTPSRSPSAAPSARRAASRSCRASSRGAGASDEELLARGGGRAAPPGRARASTRASSRTALAPGFTDEDYRERLDFELGVIERMKFPGYFLIVADFIKWAKAQGIPVGPGRGSGAGSLVA